MNAIQSFALEIKIELMKLIPSLQIISLANEKIIKINKFQQFLLNDFLDYNRFQKKAFKISK